MTKPLKINLFVRSSQAVNRRWSRVQEAFLVLSFKESGSQREDQPESVTVGSSMASRRVGGLGWIDLALCCFVVFIKEADVSAARPEQTGSLIPPRSSPLSFCCWP